jgi:hypothetical protein
VQRIHSLLLGLMLIAACATHESQEKESVATSGVPRDDSVGVRATSPNIRAEALGPRLVVDTAVTDARLDITGNEYVLRISLAMAQALQDSLPEFRPVPRSEFHKSVLSWVATSDTLSRPLSVVVGDFDADGQQDAAMMGVSGDTSATVMVLARSGGTGSRILYIHRPLRSVRTWPAETYLRFVRRGPLKVEGEMTILIPLRGDAVEVVGFEKGSVLYYLDGGVLHEVITSD